MELTKTKLGDLDFWYKRRDRFIGQRIALDKYEKFESEIIKTQINKNSVVVDVGANIGYYTVLLAPLVRKIYAFEPDKESFAILKRNVEANNLGNVVLINKAAGDQNEKVGIRRNRNNFGDNKVTKGKEIDCVKLDDVIEDKVDLMKIDVQGYEQKVIDGAKKIIDKDRPVLLVECEKELKIEGYETWSINDFAETPWPVWSGFCVKNNHGYADLWMKERFLFDDYLAVLKNVNYRKWIKGIMGYGKNK